MISKLLYIDDGALVDLGGVYLWVHGGGGGEALLVLLHIFMQKT